MRRSKIKVAVVIDEYFGAAGTAFGGYGFLARHIVCKYLPSDDIHFEVLLPRRRRMFLPTRHAVDGIAVIRPPAWPWLPLWLWLQKYDVYLTIELTHDVIEFDPRPWKRIVHWIQNPRPWYVWRRIQAMKLIPEPCFFNARLNNLVNQAQKLGRVRFISQGYSLNDYARDLYILPDSVPIEDVPNPVPFDEDFAVDACPKENLVVFLGRLESQKRGWLFCEVARRMPEYQFVVIGKFHRLSDVNKSVLEPYFDGVIPNLRFAGHLEGDAKSDYLKRAKVLLNTSVWEGIPLSFLEALAVGTLIVSNANPDNLTARFGTYVGEVEGDGLDKVELYVSAIAALMREDERRNALARDAIEYVRNRHSVDAFRRRMRQLLLEEGAKATWKRAEAADTSCSEYGASQNGGSTS